jgi:hypothetical protein
MDDPGPSGWSHVAPSIFQNLIDWVSKNTERERERKRECVRVNRKRQMYAYVTYAIQTQEPVQVVMETEIDQGAA